MDIDQQPIYMLLFIEKLKVLFFHLYIIKPKNNKDFKLHILTTILITILFHQGKEKPCHRAYY